MLNRMTDLLITDLRYLVDDLGKHGGLTSPSIYDTAQVLRMFPPSEGVWPALNWLIEQQQVDGGWGDPTMPMTRDVPTLAAVLALHGYDKRADARTAVRAGMVFLRRQAYQWTPPLPDNIPAAVELLLPHLLEEASRCGLEISHEPYRALTVLGQRRRRLISEMRPSAGTTPMHSWEAWGSDPTADIIDGSGGIGHSPAATAAWLRAAKDQPDLADHRVTAQQYLYRAAASTGTKIPGVVPNAWPITRTEQATALYGILLSGLLDHPALDEPVQRVLSELHSALTPSGLGTSDYFMTDGDDTAMALACLAGRRRVSPRCLLHFAVDGHFSTYIGELQPSLSTTAHAVHALTLLEQPSPRAVAFLRERQFADGRWSGDKWNGSWLYVTCHVLVALIAHGERDVATALTLILAHQHPDGGWGSVSSNSEETAYAAVALLVLRRANLLPAAGQEALRQAAQFLMRRYRPFVEETTSVWLAKEPYRPRHVSRAFELSALLALILEELV